MGALGKLQVSKEQSARAAYQRANPLKAKPKKTGEGGPARGRSPRRHARAHGHVLRLTRVGHTHAKATIVIPENKTCWIFRARGGDRRHPSEPRRKVSANGGEFDPAVRSKPRFRCRFLHDCDKRNRAKTMEPSISACLGHSRARAVVYGQASRSNEMQRMRAETFDPLI